MFDYNIIGSLQERVDVERLQVVDMDNSGTPEVLVVTTGKGGTPYTELKNTIYLFNSNGSIRWRYSIDREIYMSLVKDINNDLNMEVIVSSGALQDNIPRGTIRLISSRGETIRQFTRTSLNRFIYAGDINKDKYYELLTGSEGKLSYLFIDGEKIWDYPENGTLNASVYSASMIDIDNDNYDELMYSSAGVYLIDVYQREIASYEIDSEYDIANREVDHLTTAKLLSDDRPEILATTANTNTIYGIKIDELITQTDGSGHKLYTATLERIWSYEFYNKINSLKLYDVDDDKLDEIIVANEDGNLYVLDNTGSLLWSFRLENAAKDVAITDIEGDGELDIVVQSSTGSIYVLDPQGNFRWKHDTQLNLDKISLGDLDNDGIQELVVSTREPQLYAFKLNQSFIEKVKADNLYAQGERFFISSSYTAAQEKLEEAKEIYSKLGLETDVERANSLIKRIEAKLSENRRQLADVYYEKAQDFYISGDYQTSTKYVALSKEIYAEFGDADNVLKCELLELRIKTVSQSTLPIPTTPPKNQTGMDSGGFNFTQILFFGLLLLAGLSIVAYVRKRRQEQALAGPKEPWEDKALGDLDVDLIGGEDEE